MDLLCINEDRSIRDVESAGWRWRGHAGNAEWWWSRSGVSRWKMPVEGGKETQVLPSVFRRSFCVVADGIYFIPKPDKERGSSIQCLSFATGKVTAVIPISGWPTEGLSVSPDGRSLLFSQTESRLSPTPETDLMLVENFR